MKKILLLLTLTAISLNLFAQDSTLYPVSLYSFEAGAINNEVQLKWKTVCYLSYANFQIQKSLDGKNFTTINTFSADRIRCRQPFEFADNSSNENNRVFYRINVGSIDGDYFHSKIVMLNKAGSTNKFFTVYPSTITAQANMVFSSPVSFTSAVQLLNASGSVVKQWQYKGDKGTSNYTINLHDVAKGKYWLVAKNDTGLRHSVSVVKL